MTDTTGPDKLYPWRESCFLCSRRGDKLPDCGIDDCPFPLDPREDEIKTTSPIGYISSSPFANTSWTFSNGFKMTAKTNETKFKYDEPEIVSELLEYVAKTYGEHYKATDDIEAFDMWKALGSAFTSCRDTALKYLFRVTKKGSKEDHKKDIFKAIHYCILMLHILRREDVSHDAQRDQG